MKYRAMKTIYLEYVFEAEDEEAADKFLETVDDDAFVWLDEDVDLEEIVERSNA